MIKVLVVDEHQLICDGIKQILHQTEDIRVIDCVSHAGAIANKLSALESHIMLFNIYQNDEDQLTLIKKICDEYPKIKVLINAMFDSEYLIMQTIKAGAKGYLSTDDGAQELKEAIYTLRNGYDFHGRSISNILLANYLRQHREDQKGMEHLTQREKEVLHLFGNSKTNKEIAEELYISVRTVESHKNNIMKKINLKTTVDLVKFAIKNNIIQL